MRSVDPSTLRITDLWAFKSIKSNKRYIIEVEGFENEFYGLKFYWKGVEKSPNRYSLLTNDYEPRKIVRTCIEVMLNYYQNNHRISFGFVAAPDLEEDIEGKRYSCKEGSRRFIFYKRMMINLFGPKTFRQLSDTEHRIYLLVNQGRLSDGSLSIKDIEEKVNQLYSGDFYISERATEE